MAEWACDIAVLVLCWGVFAAVQVAVAVDRM